MADIHRDLALALESDDAEALGRLIRRRDERDFEALQELLSPEAPVPSHHRSRALYALGRWGEPRVVPAIERVMPRLDVRGRIAAIDALGRLGTPEAQAAVSRYADDESPQVRKFVVLALRRLGTPEAQEKLEQVARQDSQGWIRGLASRRRG